MGCTDKQLLVPSPELQLLIAEDFEHPQHRIHCSSAVSWSHKYPGADFSISRECCKPLAFTQGSDSLTSNTFQSKPDMGDAEDRPQDCCLLRRLVGKGLAGNTTEIQLLSAYTTPETCPHESWLQRVLLSSSWPHTTKSCWLG